MTSTHTLDLAARARTRARARTACVVIVLAGDHPCLYPLPLSHGEIVLGRGDPGSGIDDGAVSRQHCRVTLSGDTWRIEDLGSRNGTFVDAELIGGAPIERAAPRVVRIGSTLLVPMRDLDGLDPEQLRHADRPVIGAALGRAHRRIAAYAAESSVLHLTGESGSGKELAARRFHDAGPRARGPFVAVNCATLPGHLAERLLFGARRGAYTGATEDAPGLLHAARGGTLFLDEVAELDRAVQAKLLRFVESGEAWPLGATAPTRIELGVCSATHVDLSQAVREGSFRADLWFRLGAPVVSVPPLRERPEEIVWHAAHALAPTGLAMHVSLAERCLLSPWPGNVRELRSAVRHAATEARLRRASEARAEDLPVRPSSSPPAPCERGPDEVRDALRAHKGNVSATARALGMHRTQLRRVLAKVPLDPEE